MRMRSCVRHKLILIALLAPLIGPAASSYAAEPQWPAGRYKYMIIDQDLKDVLVEFGRNTKTPLRISDAVGGKRVRGEIKTGTAEEFFKELCAAYGLVWYFDGSILYVSSENEVRTEMIDLGRLPAKGVGEKKLLDRLQALGAADQRYAIKSAGDNLLSVSGPPAYISMVKQTLTSMVPAPRPATDDNAGVRVFRGGS